MRFLVSALILALCASAAAAGPIGKSIRFETPIAAQQSDTTAAYPLPTGATSLVIAWTLHAEKYECRIQYKIGAGDWTDARVTTEDGNPFSVPWANVRSSFRGEVTYYFTIPASSQFRVILHNTSASIPISLARVSVRYTELDEIH